MKHDELTTLLSDLSSIGVKTPMEIALEKLHYWKFPMIVGNSSKSELIPCDDMTLQMKVVKKLWGKQHTFVVTLNTMNHQVMDITHKYNRRYYDILQSEVQEVQDIINDIYEQTDQVIKPGYAALRNDPIQCYLGNLSWLLLCKAHTLHQFETQNGY